MAPREARSRLIYIRQAIRSCVLKTVEPTGTAQENQMASVLFTHRSLQRPRLADIPTPNPNIILGGNAELRLALAPPCWAWCVVLALGGKTGSAQGARRAVCPGCKGCHA